jgi:LmbE family N-acetylglucosaminyl deacetylase
MIARQPGAFAAVAGRDAPSRHLFLSPHYDDIALSCGGTAALLSLAGRAPEVALLFGAEPDPARPLTAFARWQHENWGLDAAGAIAARRAEEACAAAVLGTRVTFLPFHDAIYRSAWYTGDDVLFGTPAPEEAGLADDLVAALDLPAEPDGAVRIYVPLAIGAHVDHQHAYAAGVRLARAGWNVWFYEEQPYALRAGTVTARFARIEERLIVAGVVDIAAVWEAKLGAVLCYPSQLAMPFRYVPVGASRAEIEAAMRAYALGIGGDRPAERYWRLA